MISTTFARVCLALSTVFLIAACGPRSAEVSPVPPPPTTEDFYGAYEIIFGGAGESTPGTEMIATWNESGVTVEQMGNPILQFQLALGTNPGEMEIWSEDVSDPLCLAEGVYQYTDDGTTITFTLVSDGCENRRQSADGGRLVRRD